MSIHRIEHVFYGVDNLQVCNKFFENWGLDKVENGTSGSVFRTLENQFISLRKRNDKSLPPTDEKNSTVREIIWGVKDRQELNDIASELSTDREVTLDEEGVVHCQDDSGNCIGFSMSKFTPAKTSKTRLNIHEKVDRLNERGWPNDRIKPLRIGHIVYSIESEGNWEAAKFYMDRLKFRLSDRSKDGGTFLRAEGSQYHHSLFLFHRQGTRRYFNHLAFEVNSFDDIMVGGSHMVKSGAESVSGPGRHSLGSNWFWYFKNPAGGDIEYFADMDRLDDDWEPGFWEKSPPYARWMIGEDVLTG